MSGFGGFVGASKRDAAAAAAAAALPPEVQLALSKLGKRDATTKLKALGALREAVASPPLPADVFWPLLLPPLLAALPRLSSDASRAVRCALCGLAAALVAAGGRGVAAHARPLLAHWLPLQFDPEPEVAAAASASLDAAFPGAKRAEAGRWAAGELRAAAEEALRRSSPADLPEPPPPGEAGAEEGAERLLRGHVAALRTLALLAAGGSAGDWAPPLLRPWLAAPAPQARAAAYALAAALWASGEPACEPAGGVEACGEALRRALAESSAAALPDALGCALAACRALGARAWEPGGGASPARLAAALGGAALAASAAASAPAALPLLAQLPARLLLPPPPPAPPSASPAVASALAALWAARARCGASDAPGRSSLAAAYRDCAVYAPLRLRQAALEAGWGEAAASEAQCALLQATLLGAPLAALLAAAGSGERDALAALLAGAARALSAKASLAPSARARLWAELAAAAAGAAEGGGEAAAALAGALAENGPGSDAADEADNAFFAPLAAALLPPATPGRARLLTALLLLRGCCALPPPAAAALLADPCVAAQPALAAALLRAPREPAARAAAWQTLLLSRPAPGALASLIDALGGGGEWAHPELDAALLAAARDASAAGGEAAAALLRAALCGGCAGAAAEAASVASVAAALGGGGGRALDAAAPLLRAPRLRGWPALVAALFERLLPVASPACADDGEDSDGEAEEGEGEEAEAQRLWAELCGGAFARAAPTAAAELAAGLGASLRRGCECAAASAAARAAAALAPLARAAPAAPAAFAAALLGGEWPVGPAAAALAATAVAAARAPPPPGAPPLLAQEGCEAAAAALLRLRVAGGEEAVGAALQEGPPATAARLATATLLRLAAAGEAAPLCAALRLLPRLGGGAAAAADALWRSQPLAAARARAPPPAAAALLAAAAPLLRPLLGAEAGEEWRGAAEAAAEAAGEALRRARGGGEAAARAEAAAGLAAALLSPAGEGEAAEAEAAALQRLWAELCAAEAAGAAAAAALRRAQPAAAADAGGGLDGAAAALAPALLRCAADRLGERDWAALLARPAAWLRAAEARLAGGGGLGEPALAGLPTAALRLLQQLRRLPLEVADPGPDGRGGDCVPYASGGARARALAGSLARAGWPAARCEAAAAAAGCLLAAGAALARGADPGPFSAGGAAAFWAELGGVLCPPPSARAAAEAADAREGCGAVASLFALLRLADGAEAEEGAGWGLADAALRLLHAPPLREAALWGLDASVAETPRVLELLAAAGPEAEEGEGVEGRLMAAAAAGLRAPLAALLCRPWPSPATQLAWTLPLAGLLGGWSGSARAEALRAWLQAAPAPPLAALLASQLPLLPLPSARALRAGAPAAQLPPALREAWAAAAAPAAQLPAAARAPPPARAALLLGAALAALPGGCRAWFAGLRDAAAAQRLEAAVAALLSPQLVSQQLQQLAAEGGGGGRLAVRLSGRDVLAAYSVDDVQLEVTLRFGGAFPLRAPEAACARRVGVSEARLRKWLLAVNASLRAGGGVAAALRLWADSCSAEFDGVEPCPICYMTLHAGTRALPRLACKQCRNRFHAACMYSWFDSSGKSSCPICQVPFGTEVR